MKKIFFALLLSLITCTNVFAQEVGTKTKLSLEEKIEKKTEKIASLKEKQSKVQVKLDELNKIPSSELSAEQKIELENLSAKLEFLNAKETRVSSKLAELKAAK